MKTKLSALLVLSTALILTSCGGKAEEALNEAKEYYYQTIKDDSTSLQSYELNSKLVVAGVTYNVEWELNVTSGSADVVKLGAVNAQGKYPVTIDFDKATQSETKYTISCTIKDADGNETSFELDRTVPKFTFVDHATYVKECKENDGDIISIKAYVIGAIGKESSSSFGSLYLQDAQGNGYYAYAPSLSLPKKSREALNAAFPIGSEVIVTGSATQYSGQYEFNKGCSAVTTGNTAESAGVSLTYTDATADFAAAETPKDAAKLDKYQNARVTLEDCKLISNSGDYYYFTVGNSSQQFNVYKTNYFLKDEDVATLLAKFSAGSTADITGIVSVYSGTFQIYPDTLDTIKVTATATPEDLANAFFDSVKFSSSVDADVTLPKQEGLTWSLKAASDAAVITDGVLKVTRQAEDATVTLVASYVVSGETFTKEYEVVVAKVVSDEPILVTAPEVGVGYKFGCYQENLGKDLWLAGNKSGNYLATVEDPAEAATVYLEATEGGYHLAVGTGEDKKYVNVTSYTSGEQVKQSQDIGDTPTSVWTYDAELKTLVTVNADLGTEAYYIGTYSSFNTMSSSRVSYAATSFVNHLYTLPNPETEVVTTLEAGKAYKFEVFQANAEVNKNIYLSGEMAGNYLGSTDNYYEAADVYLEATTGGYYIAVGTGDAKQYVNLATYTSGEQVKSSQKIEAEAKSVWTYDAELKTLVTTHADLGTDKYYIGTYSTFTTLSCSKTSYASTSYVGHLVVKAGDEEAETPEVNVPAADLSTPLDGTINAALPTGFTYITNNPDYPNPSFYSNGGLKLNFENMGIVTSKFAAQTAVTVNVKVLALNGNQKSTEGTDIFTVYGLNEAGEVVATAKLTSVVVGDNNVNLTGTGIVQVKVVMTAYPKIEGVCQNVSLGAVVVSKTA